MNSSTHSHSNASNKNNNWIWPLFACAVGAGILYLPINAGLFGIWPFIVLLVLTFPVVYLCHWYLTRFVLTASKGTTNINDIVYENFSERFSQVFAICYFFSIFPLTLIYTVGLTNTINSVLINNFSIEIPRFILAFVILFSILVVVVTKPVFIRKVTKFLALPLAAFLFSLSVYLIPKWHMDHFQIFPNITDLLTTLFFTLPVIIFAINYMPIISTFALSHAEHPNPEKATSNTLWRASLLIFAFSMFFVFSCIMCLSPDNMAVAKQTNTNILVYMGNYFNDPILKVVNPMIAIIAMTGACFSSFFGVKESVIGLIEQKLHRHKLASKRLDHIAIALILIPCYIVCVCDTSILGLMSKLSGPIIALLLFVFPVYAVYKMPKLYKYNKTMQDKLGNYYVLIVGLISCSAILYSFKDFLYYFL